MSVELPGVDVDAALNRVRADGGVSLAFLGVADDTAVKLRHFAGPTIGALRDVPVAIGQGLGGRVIAQNRPIVVDDYLRTRRITHRYDHIIAAEGLRAMAAAPVIVDRRPVAVLYAALRSDEAIGTRTLDSLAAEARAIEQAMVARASVAAQPDADVQDRVSRAFSRIRQLTREVDDPRISAELAALLVAPEVADVELPQRERDVISLVALGYSNARVAQEMELTVYTVKSYLRDAMRTLGASNRREAVLLARRAGLIA